MKKIWIVGLVLLVLAGTVFALNYSNMWYYAKDKVSGTNIPLIQFQDDLGIIDAMVYNEMVKRNTNSFKANVGFGVDETGDNYVYDVNNFAFSGLTTFDDNSNVKYEVTDFNVTDTNVDQYGVTEAYGDAMLTYTATIKIERKIPVKMSFSLVQDEEDKEGFGNSIKIQGDDINIEFEDFDTQTFRHNRKCYVGCD